MSDERERLLARLQEEGNRRREALASASEALDAITELIPPAIEAGIAKREISRLTGVSRVWIDELLRRMRPDS